MGSTFSAVLAAASHADVSLLFLLLALVAFGCAVFAAFRGAIAAAVACAFVGLVILLFGA